MKDAIKKRYSELAQELGHIMTIRDRANDRIAELQNEIKGIDNLQGYINKLEEAEKVRQNMAAKPLSKAE